MQAVFIIEKRNKILIFLNVIDSSITINQQELSKILGGIVSGASDLQINAIAKTQINEKQYIFGNFERILVIAQYSGEAENLQERLIKINNNFIERYLDILDNYTEKDIVKFKNFVNVLKEILEEKKQIKEIQKPIKNPSAPKIEAEPEKAESKKPAPSTEKKIEIPKPKGTPITEITVENIGSVPLIPASKREAFPSGIPEYKRDEVLWEESQNVQNEYIAEFIEGMISQLNVFLSISLTHHYELHIDFSGYPLEPRLEIGPGLQKELVKPIEELLFHYKNWDSKVPPHIIEIVREFEALLMKFKAWGKLSDTSEMPETALPELEPLPELPPLEDYEAKSESKKKKQKLEPEIKEEELKIIPQEEEPQIYPSKPDEMQEIPETTELIEPESKGSKEDKKEKKKSKNKKEKKKK